ncbi:MAG TPA: 30S ribosome-binding factor RbfA [Gammaproteobacteria bacterium]|nr:30S ribosome-binding factor RbfA [Gammaproteobacteria bacterium]
MPKEFPRARRVGEQLQRELSVLIRDELRDPRLGMVSISGVEVSKDLGHAKVFVTTLDGEQEARQSIEALTGAAGYLRRLLGQRLVMRTVPQLHFRYDRSLQRGAELSALIDKAVKSDRDKADGGEADD